MRRRGRFAGLCVFVAALGACSVHVKDADSAAGTFPPRRLRLHRPPRLSPRRQTQQRR